MMIRTVIATAAVAFIAACGTVAGEPVLMVSGQRRIGAVLVFGPQVARSRWAFFGFLMLRQPRFSLANPGRGVLQTFACTAVLLASRKQTWETR